MQQESIEKYIAPILEKQNQRIESLEQQLHEQAKIIETLRMELEQLRDAKQAKLPQPKQIAERKPSINPILPKPRDLDNIHEEKQRRNTLNASKIISPDLNKSQIMQAQRTSISKEPTNPYKKGPPVKQTSKPIETRGLSNSQSQKDLRTKDKQQKQDPRTINQSTIKKKPSVAQLQTTVTNFSQQEIAQTDSTQELLMKLEIERIQTGEDVDLLAEESSSKRVSSFVFNQQIDLNPANPNTYDDLIRLCRGDFKADLVIKEVHEQFSMYDKGPFIKELKLIKEQYESNLKLIKPSNNREYKRSGEWMSQWAKQSISLISNGFVDDLLENKYADPRILDVFELFFICSQTNFTRTSDGDFWAFIKKFLKENEKDFEQSLASLEQRGFTIYQLMSIEKYIQEHPHVYDKETYEDFDALSGVLAFIFSDLVEYFGLDETQNTQQRYAYLHEKSLIYRNRIKELECLLQELPQ